MASIYSPKHSFQVYPFMKKNVEVRRRSGYRGSREDPVRELHALHDIIEPHIGSLVEYYAES